VLLPTEPYHFTGEDARGFMLPGEDACPRHIQVVEGELLSWFGSRLVRALTELPAILARGSRA